MPEIRRAALRDLEEIWSLVGRAVAHMNTLGNPQWGADYPTRAHYEADIARGELYLALRFDGRVLGVACINTDQAEEYAPLPWTIPGPAMVIHRMAIDPAAQRQGIATALFRFAEELARGAGIATMHMDTYAQNSRMQALVRRMGYEPTGEVSFSRPNRPLTYPCFEKVLS